MRSVAELVAATAPARAGRAAPTAASVNLLSPATLESLAVARIKKRFLAAALALAVLVAAGWLAQTRQLPAGEERLAAEVAATAPLRNQLRALDPVAQFFAAVAQRRQTAASAIAAEVLFSRALADLDERTPQGLQIRTMSVTLPEEPSAGTAEAQGQAQAQDSTCARPDPFDPAEVIGCVSLTGTAPTRGVVAALIRNLDAGSLYADPFVTTTSYGQGLGGAAVQFVGTVGLTPAALSGRYADLRWLSDPKVLAEAYRQVEAGRAAAVQFARQAAARAQAGESAEGAGP